MSHEVAYEPVSLGYRCEVKYQLSRHWFLRRNPSSSASAVRAIMGFSQGAAHFKRHIFDFQINPFAAVIEYLERDFIGVFEQEDLFIDDVTGEVSHRRLGTSHPHEFADPPAGAGTAFIARHYPAVRSKFDHLARRFRQHLREPGDFLYTFREIRSADEAEHLLSLLTGASPDHRAHLLLVGCEGDDADLSRLRGRVTKAWCPNESGKPADLDWEGPDAAWDAVLAPFPLVGAVDPVYARS